ncbi:hypothetical protein LOTGIDRAFT_214061 [Lottia gigantea]|uniref:Rieske domain-containing protein n=1 Tax=Lottia gigantea TaxID=225164 RepID=V4C6F1_LOTGI|nr:hypothetical protein LOTGIDRAFT_214061 [Lottia gigantea]ESO97239.1 hypothetical protein LOTGIDRAFT_214061 [Lottia gigantea]
MTQQLLCNVDDIQDGGMKEVEIDGNKILLVQECEQYYAVGGKCSHYGAPLANGSLCKGVVRCPWHGACFDVKTGDIEDFPGLDSLPTYQVVVKSGKIYLKDGGNLASTKRVKSMCRQNADNRKTFILIGGGPASVVCSETLRQEGFTGRIVIISKEPTLPYDRPKLSKAMDSKPEAIALRNEEFYKNYDIEIKKGHEVVSVDVKSKTVQLYDRKKLSFDSLFIATGGKPRSLPIKGVDLQNVFTLRTPADAKKIYEAAQGKHVVVIGSSFIGLEVASCLAGKVKSLSVVDMIQVPFQKILGQRIGQVFQKLHEDKGVKFHLNAGLEELKGREGVLTDVVLKDKTKLSADVCILGVGVVPGTGFLKGSGIELSDRGFVSVNQNLETNIKDVYAGGDIVEFPLFITPDNSKVNIQHWQMAHQHGRVGGRNMAGIKTDIKSVPYFWTVMYGKSVRYTGYGVGFDDVIIHGDLEAPKFAAFYTKGDNVVAVASLAYDPIVSQAAQLLTQGEQIKKSEIKDDPNTWTKRLSN